MAGDVQAAVLPAAERITLLKEDFQLIQRNPDDRGTCLIKMSPEVAEPADCEFTLADGKRAIRSGHVRTRDRAGLGQTVLLESLPVGGPYTVTVSSKSSRGNHKNIFRNILVGDIWVLGGQSNMFGIDVIKEKLPALPYLNILDARHFLHDAHWCAGVPPIHRIPEPFAAFTLKSQHPDWSDEQIKRTIASGIPIGGIDCSYFFARKLCAESGVPIGLIPCATGGALAIWDPAQQDRNRYGFMLHHVRSTGGRVRGLLFFQGEQDAIFGDAQKTVTSPSLIYPIRTYGQQFKTFVEAFRKDCNDEALPVLLAQICRHHSSNRKDSAAGWEIIREAQRRIPENLPRAHCVPTVDLDVVDGLHLDYDSLKRVGERMAYLALPYVKQGVEPRSEIKLVSVHLGTTLKPTIVVEFSGVTGKLRAAGRPTGFRLKDRATGEYLDWIYKVDFDAARPNAVILSVARQQNREVDLYYAAGAAPYVNLVDDNDMPLPAFGPIELKLK
jgi:sialate O-acetylesterase